MRFGTLASRVIAGALLVVIAATSVACGTAITPSTSAQSTSAQPSGSQPATPAPAATVAEKSGIANPASTNCVDKGGKLDIVKGQAGEIGMCILPDGTTCEEWALFRGECKPGDKQSQLTTDPAAKFCADNGGKVEVIGAGTAGEWGKCVFKDNSFCDEWSYFRGACKPGDQKP
jgi:uncharacterized protein